MTKLDWTLFWSGTAIGFIGMAFSGRYDWLGVVAGYWVGFLNTMWLFRDTLKSVELDTNQAIKKMRRSFFSRLGAITLVVVIFGRWQEDLLLSLISGVAIGLIVSIVIKIRQFNFQGKG